jgi:hypothetical protein
VIGGVAHRLKMIYIISCCVASRTIAATGWRRSF